MPLREIRDARQVKGEEKRQWFSSAAMDLIVWSNEAGEITGFQLCYDKEGDEKAFTWTMKNGFSHMMVDDGEGMINLGHKASPILTVNAACDPSMIASLFGNEAENLPDDIERFVLSKIKEYAAPSTHLPG